MFSGKADVAGSSTCGVDVERAGFDTVGGYLLARAGPRANKGERVDVDGLAVEVLEAERRRVHPRPRPEARPRPRPTARMADELAASSPWSAGPTPASPRC